MNLFLAATSLLFIASSSSAATNLRGVEQPRFLSHSSTKSTKKTKSSSGNSSEGDDYRSVCVIRSSCDNVSESDIKNAARDALDDYTGSSSSDKSSSKNSKKSRTRHLHSTTTSGSSSSSSSGSGSKSKSGSSSSDYEKTFTIDVDSCGSRSSDDIIKSIEKDIRSELSGSDSSSGSRSSSKGSSRRGRRLSKTKSSSGSTSSSSSSSSGDGANLKMICFREDDLVGTGRCSSSSDVDAMAVAWELANNDDFRRRHLGSADVSVVSLSGMSSFDFDCSNERSVADAINKEYDD